MPGDERSRSLAAMLAGNASGCIYSRIDKKEIFGGDLTRPRTELDMTGCSHVTTVPVVGSDHRASITSRRRRQDLMAVAI